MSQASQATLNKMIQSEKMRDLTDIYTKNFKNKGSQQTGKPQSTSKLTFNKLQYMNLPEDNPDEEEAEAPTVQVPPSAHGGSVALRGSSAYTGYGRENRPAEVAGSRLGGAMPGSESSGAISHARGSQSKAGLPSDHGLM